MALHSVTLEVPESIFKSARRTAKAVERPVEDVLVTALKSSLPPLVDLPANTSKELNALEAFRDEQLLAIARETFPQTEQKKLSRLLQKNQAGKLAEHEQSLLEKLISASERLMLRKARAFVLLKWRGYSVNAFTGQNGNS